MTKTTAEILDVETIVQGDRVEVTCSLERRQADYVIVVPLL
jgi:hypothetical protein